MKGMKRHFVEQLFVLCAAVLVFSACDSTDPVDEDPPLIPNQEGFYVFGTNTIAENALDLESRMSRAVLDPNQGAQVQNMPGVYGKFMYIGANGRIEFTNFENDVSTDFGVTGGGSQVSAGELGNVPLEAQVIFGTLEEDGPPVQVAAGGLYYTFVNTNDSSVVLMRVEPNIIGDATQGQWETGTPLPMVSASVDGAVFEATNVPLSGHSGYRHRFSNGWHAYASPDVVTLSSLGVEDYGAAWDAGEYEVGFHLDNIPNHESGLFTMRLEYDAETGAWSETKTRTGNLSVDHSTTEMGLFGNAFEGGDWTEGNGYGLHTPDFDGTTYTWTWENVPLIEEHEFIFLEGASWGGLEVNYQGAAVQGTAIDAGQIVDATSIGNEFANFYVVEAGEYDLILELDAASGDRTVTISQ